ncbi:hypothetical protein BDZ89DRAFT_1038418 [Hymenopellis radicata]|nr:hypothetical protein BDZ89DRAFT_1038418 [Hymenopellis radicata]
MVQSTVARKSSFNGSGSQAKQRKVIKTRFDAICELETVGVEITLLQEEIPSITKLGSYHDLRHTVPRPGDVDNLKKISADIGYNGRLTYDTSNTRASGIGRMFKVGGIPHITRVLWCSEEAVSTLETWVAMVTPLPNVVVQYTLCIYFYMYSALKARKSQPAWPEASTELIERARRAVLASLAATEELKKFTYRLISLSGKREIRMDERHRPTDPKRTRSTPFKLLPQISLAGTLS